MSWRAFGLVTSSVKSLLRTLGYDIHKIQAGRDPFREMQRLVGVWPQSVIFDVGANVGDTIESFRAVLPRAEIHSFEPSPETFRKLQEKCSAMPNLFLNSAAMGAAPGVAEFVENTDSTMSSFLEPGKACWGEIKRRVQVRVTTIDRYCDERKIESIDILKSDTQGFDLEVIRGAYRLLAEHRIHLIYMEIIFSEMYRGLPRVDEILRFLADCGFVLVALYNLHYQDGRLGWADALFVDPKFGSRASDCAAAL
jgi:FkbM family methyltransferase